MRIVVCHPGPEFSVNDVYVGWVEALRNLGAKIIEFNLADRLAFYDHAWFKISDHYARKACNPDQAIEMAVNGLYATLYKTRPDVLLAVSGFFLEPELLDLVRWSRTRVVILHTESPYEDDRQLALAPHADINILNDPTSLPRFRALGEAHYFPHCYRETLHKPGPAKPELVCDLGFVGTGYPSRMKFLEEMNLEGLDVFLGGNWQAMTDASPLRKYLAHEMSECLDNHQAVDVYRSMKVGLNLYRQETEDGSLREGWSMGPREVEIAATGTFFLREWRGEGDEVFPMLPSFSTPEEASELLHYWLARPEARAELARQARTAIADRTFTRQAAELLRLLDKAPVTA